MTFQIGMQLLYFAVFLSMAYFKEIRRPTLWLSFSGAVYFSIYVYLKHYDIGLGIFGIYTYIFRFLFDLFIVSMLLGFDEYIYCKFKGIKPATIAPINAFVVAMTTILVSAVFLNGVSIVEYNTPSVVVYDLYSNMADAILASELLIGGIFCVGNFINLLSPDIISRDFAFLVGRLHKEADEK